MEIEQRCQPGRDETQDQGGRQRRGRRCEVPRPLEHHRQRRDQQRAGHGGARCHHAARQMRMAPREHRRHRVAHCPEKHRQLSQESGPQAAERLHADEHEQPAKTDGDAAAAPDVERLVGNQGVGQGGRGDGHDAHEDGGQAAVDVDLAPADEAEGECVAEQTYEQEHAPRSNVEWDGLAARQRIAQQQHGGDGEPHRRQRHRCNRRHGDLDQHERRAPHGRQHQQQQVVLQRAGPR